MGFLRHISDIEYQSANITNPTVVYVGEKDKGFIRYSAPEDYEYLDGSDEAFASADGDFLVKKE
jgi:hypothetical protein